MIKLQSKIIFWSHSQLIPLFSTIERTKRFNYVIAQRRKGDLFEDESTEVVEFKSYFWKVQSMLSRHWFINAKEQIEAYIFSITKHSTHLKNESFHECLLFHPRRMQLMANAAQFCHVLHLQDATRCHSWHVSCCKQSSFRQCFTLDESIVGARPLQQDREDWFLFLGECHFRTHQGSFRITSTQSELHRHMTEFIMHETHCIALL